MRSVFRSLSTVFLCAVWLIAGAHLPATAEGSDSPGGRPNFVFILVDDLGWADVGCYGSTFHETPHVDRLAVEGMRFTGAYAAACACSPTRASIMTGQYPARLNLTTILYGRRSPDDSPILPVYCRDFLPPKETTIAEILKGAGYTTCLVGKYHLGFDRNAERNGPLHRGFDVAIAPPHNGMPKAYFWPQWKGNPTMEGRFEGEYLTDRLAEDACRFVETNRDGPFFLYMAFYSVHVPIEAKADKVARYEAKLRDDPSPEGGQSNPHYAAMVEAVDDGVGRLAETLRRLGIEEQTIVIFFSDNGGLAHPSHVGDHTPATTNAPLRLGKGFLYEGGIREPLIVKWPGVVAPGSVCGEPVISNDFFATISEMASVTPDRADASAGGNAGCDGVSLVPLLKNPKRRLQREALFWHYPHFSSMGGRPSGAIRASRWKLLEHFETGRVELYDLEKDLGETNDLAQAEPAKTRELHRMLVDWRESVDAKMPDQPNPKYRRVTSKP